MTKLSPQAQAVLDAFTEDNSLHDWKHNHHNTEALAAALRAAVKQVEFPPRSDAAPLWNEGFDYAQQVVLREFLAIATELETQ